jgi:hypothetical protein
METGDVSITFVQELRESDKGRCRARADWSMIDDPF